jgi:hypothetical protein
MENRISRGEKLIRVINIWRNYLFSDEKSAFTDFAIWAETTFFRRSMISLEIPWINFRAARYLESILQTGMSVFEWGSGSSTFFLCKHAVNMISIEHDEKYFEVVKAALFKKGYQLDYRLILPEPEQEYAKMGWGNRYHSTNENFKDSVFYKYACAVNEFPDDHFDVILIDGRSRISCFQNAVQKIKKGGVIVFDNTDIADYEALFDLMPKGWGVKTISGPIPSNIYPIISSTTFITRV